MTNRARAAALSACAALIAALGAVQALGGESAAANPPVAGKAHADLRALTGRESRGTIDFYRTARAMAVHVNVHGLKPGMHALHVHTAACGDSDSEADMQLDSQSRASRTARRSPADLGMVLADPDGNADQWLRTDQLDIAGARGIVGKSIVLHARGIESKVQQSGGIGEPVACGAVVDASGDLVTTQ